MNIVGLNYAITNLPYEFDIHGNYPGIVVEPYITAGIGTPVQHNTQFSEADILELSFQPYSTNSVGIKRSSDSDARPNNKHRRTEENYSGVNDNAITHNILGIPKRSEELLNQEFYLETLVFITSDIAEFFESLYGTNNYIEWLVRYYILYFNGVDMMFEKIRTKQIALRINIAKIVIEDKSQPFDFINNDELKFTDTIVKLRKHLKTNHLDYTPDSFDHIFISTKKTIMYKSNSVTGATQFEVDLYAARKHQQFYNAVPITAAGFLNDHSIAVDEISRIFIIDNNSWLKELEHNGQINNIMRAGIFECDQCLEWRDDMKKQFKLFFSQNRNRCFLLNEPRSVRPPGVSRFVSPLQQCRCFGYDSYILTNQLESRKYVKQPECSSLLPCMKVNDNQIRYEYTVRPFDGTNCGNNKVCWNGKCTAYKPICRLQKKIALN